VQEERIGLESSERTSNSSGHVFISPRELSSLIGVNPTTLATWRRRGVGPTWYRIEGHLIRYHRTEVLAWIRAQRTGDTLSGRNHSLERPTGVHAAERSGRK
jgi:hypothetical protein